MSRQAQRQIKEAGKIIRELMITSLEEISSGLIKKIMSRVNDLSDANKLNAIKDLQVPGVNSYKEKLQEALAIISGEALAQARKEVPKKKSVKLAEFTDEGRLLFGEFEKLPLKIRKQIKTRNELLIGTQIADLEKAIFFQFTSSAPSTDSMRQLEFDLKESADDFIYGNSIAVGALSTSSSVVNEVRTAFFFDDEVLSEIEAFIFVNGDPVSEICQELAGQIFPKDDPNLFRYTPPLHYNCKSTIEPILSGELGNKEPQLLEPSKKAIDSIQFGENLLKSCKCCF